MGPPGAGKGTQAVNIVDTYGVCHISTGDMFREAIKAGTEMGNLAQSFISKGELVPDSVTVGIVRDRLAQDDCKNNGFLLDGFPRNLDQARALDEIMAELGYNLTGVINIDVDKNALIGRIVGRQICKSCGASYHVTLKKPQVEGICDRCGSPLFTRPDDTEEVLVNRLNVYEGQTAPLLAYYNERGLVMNVDGNQELDEVFAQIKEYLK
jgi:adenylate kinase